MTTLPITALVTALVMLLAGCSPEDPDPTSTLDAVDASAPERVELAGGAGPGLVEMPVLLVNSYGAAVPGSSVQVGLDQPGFDLETAEIQLDAEGYGLARVFAVRPGAFELTVLSSADGAAAGARATGVALGAPAPSLELDSVLPRPAELGEAMAMARGTGGLALVGEDSVWWVPATPGAVAWRVLAPPFSILGVRQANVDADGVHDLVVWGEQEVVLLRGRAAGGYSWGAAWASPDMQVVGVSVDDIDGDQLSDIVVGQTDDATARVEMLLGDGVWGFQAVSPLQLDYPIRDLVAADEDADGRPDITVLDDLSGWLRRYTRSEGRWTGNSPPQLDRYDFPAGSKLLPPSDLNGDGVKDIIAVSGPGSGAQSVVFYVLVDNDKYEQSYAVINADVYDVDQDGAVDLLLMEDGILHRIRYDFAVSGFVVENLDDLALAGPISAGDLTGDGVPDLSVLEDGVVLHKGQTDSSGTWSVGSPHIQELLSGLTGPFELFDVDGDGDRDVVGIVKQGGGPALRVWLAEWNGAGGISYTTAGTLELGVTGDAHALSHCEPDWYVLADNSDAGGADSDKAWRVRIEAGSGFVPYVAHSTNTTGSLLTCGFPDSPHFRRFTVGATDGHVMVYSFSAEIISEDDLGPIAAIANADMDGDGIDELYSCTEADCELLGADLDGDGTDELIMGGGAVSVDGWGSSYDLNSFGTISVDDLDGDGVLDVLVADSDSGRITAVPTLTGAMGPASAWFTTEEITGKVRVTDYDLDGLNELVFPKATQLVGTNRTETEAGTAE